MAPIQRQKHIATVFRITSNIMIISIGTVVCFFLLMMILREIHRYRLFPIPVDQQHTLQSSSEVEDIYLEINAPNVLV